MNMHLTTLCPVPKAASNETRETAYLNKEMKGLHMRRVESIKIKKFPSADG